MIDSVQKPSPTITLYNQLAAATMAQNRSSNTRSVKYNRKNAAHTQKQLVDTQQLQTTMDSLESQIQTVKQQSNVVPKEARQQQFSLNDILPVSLNKAEAAQENQSENATNDNIMDANIPMQEKIKILRQHPDLLRKFVLESQQIQRQEAINTYNNHLVQRKQHRNLICRGLPQIKFIDNFVTHNLAQNISDAMRKSRLQAKRQYQGMLTDAQIDNVLSRKRNLLEREEFDAQNNVSQPKISTILPMIFINQRNTLGVYLFFSSRIAVLRQVGAVYDKIKRSDNLILWAKGIILRGLSNRHQFNREQAELRAAFLITRNLRIYVNRRNKNNRISSLRTAKALLLENYNQQCFLGAVVRFTSSKELIVQSVHDLNTKNNARVHVLMSYLLGYQKNSAFQIWKTEKTILSPGKCACSRLILARSRNSNSLSLCIRLISQYYQLWSRTRRASLSQSYRQRPNSKCPGSMFSGCPRPCRRIFSRIICLIRNQAPSM
uniref:Uncharacterized protein n=1 Tax=Spironucleus salmonicida TaxID=348837 RepID=V6M1H4_9EUKA|eukprot:EST47039.1 hypothetical protein SS50377_12918 [Spironucleus salmonicida]